MYDTEGKLLVWTGLVHKAIDLNSRQKERQENLNTAAKKLLMRFPPK